MHTGARMPNVVIVGTGMVGTSIAYALIMKGLVQNLGLINRSPEKAEGEAMDLKHCLPFVSPVNIRAGGFELCKDAQVVVVTAGATQAEGETRLDLCGKNARIIKGIVQDILEYNPAPIILVVTNPVDVLTYVALRESGLPPERVIGSGTVLDTARFRSLVAEHCSLDTRNTHGYVIGEHGDSEVLVWSRLNIAGVLMNDYCGQACTRECPDDFRGDIDDNVRNAAYEIIKKKGATYYAVALAVVSILETVLKNHRSVLTVSSLMQGQYGISNVCLSLPSLLGSRGVENVLDSPLADNETHALRESARVLRETLESIGY
jgi:L-lactate dehydrogenase